MSPDCIIVSGAMGRMGQAILRLADEKKIPVAGVLEAPSRIQSLGRSSIQCGTSEVPLAASLKELLGVIKLDSNKSSKAVLIEFTTPEATRDHVRMAPELGIKMVIGTTGLTAEDYELIEAASKKTAVLSATNMSVGVNVLLGIVAKLSSVLPDYDIEIVEMHHRLKKDAPSGTAISLAESAAAGRGKKLKDIAVYGREGIVGERPAGEIGVHALRGGSVIGDHTVMFAADPERIEITHKAQSRDAFAAGALRAAQYLFSKSSGLFTMSDVLGI